MTGVVTEIEAIEGLDFNPELLCEPRLDPCDAPAKWLLTKYCCPKSYALCDLHVQLVRDFFEKYPQYHCSDCNSSDFPWEVEPL